MQIIGCVVVIIDKCNLTQIFDKSVHRNALFHIHSMRNCGIISNIALELSNIYSVSTIYVKCCHYFWSDFT